MGVGRDADAELGREVLSEGGERRARLGGVFDGDDGEEGRVLVGRRLLLVNTVNW